MKNREETNPFINEFVIETSEIRFKGISLGIVEKNKPLSVWTNAGSMKAILQLSSSAKDMIFYIMNCLGDSTDIIEIEYEKYKLKTGLDLSLRTFQRAVADLDKKVITDRKARKNTYWINPRVFYRGNRIKDYVDNVEVTYVDPNILLMREKKILKERKPLRELFFKEEDE
jgi:hypothetical protein